MSFFIVVPVVFVVVFMFAAYHTVKVLNRIAWILGAMESHSDLTLKMEARDRDIPMVTHDKTDPYFKGKPVHLKQIKCGIPLKSRKGAPPWFWR